MNGIRIMKNDLLQPMTVMVSPDLYQQLTETPEQAEARREYTLTQLATLAAMVKTAASRKPSACQQPQAHPARCGCGELP